jgi:tetratricopeptide (TPR) repeat protein
LAIRNSPDPTSGIKARADAEIRNGRIDQAENLLKEALDQYPDSVLLFGSLAPIIRIGANDSALVDRMERLYSEAALRPALRQTLAFALGKAFNDLSDYRKAIDFYDEANRLREQMFPESHRFNRSALAASTEFQIRYFTKERILRYRDRALQDPRPIFVIGMIRSGTSLTEQILSGHSQIHAAGELMFWNGHWPEVIHPTRETWRYGRTLELGREYLQILERDSAGRPFTTDKHPMNYQFTAPLHTVFPQAKFVQILRHPVDNLLSIWMTPMTSGIQFVSRRDDLVFLYRQYQRLTRHLEELLPPTQYHAFRYEDITSQPELEIRSLLTYLGLPPEPACFEPENRERTVRTPSAQQVRQPIHPRSQQRWKPYEPWLAEFAELLESE